MESKKNKEKVNDDTVSSSSGLDCPSCDEGEAMEYDIQVGFYFKPCNFCKGTGKLNERQSKNLIKARKIYKKMKTI